MVVIKEIIEFFKTHWIHVLIGIPAIFVFTAFHELAHCVPVWAQGGMVTDFTWLPSANDMGHINYAVPPENAVGFSHAAVSVGPCAAEAALCVIAFLLSFRRKAWPFWAASSIFIWLFLVPLADAAMSAVAQMSSNQGNDLYHALGPPTAATTTCLLLIGMAMAVLGYITQKRLYRNRAVSLQAYTALGIIAAVGLVAARLI